MSNVKIGKTPKTFKPFVVKFPMADGEEGNILATFHYRTITQFGQFLNQVFADAGEVKKVDENDAGEVKKVDEKPDFQTLFFKNKEKNAEHLEVALAAWDVEVPLNRENLQALADEYPGAAIALMTAYNKACTEHRLGN